MIIYGTMISIEGDITTSSESLIETALPEKVGILRDPS